MLCPSACHTLSCPPVGLQKHRVVLQELDVGLSRILLVSPTMMFQDLYDARVRAAKLHAAHA